MDKISNIIWRKIIMNNSMDSHFHNESFMHHWSKLKLDWNRKSAYEMKYNKLKSFFFFFLVVYWATSRWMDERTGGSIVCWWCLSRLTQSTENSHAVDKMICSFILFACIINWVCKKKKKTLRVFLSLHAFVHLKHRTASFLNKRPLQLLNGSWIEKSNGLHFILQ